MSKFFVVLILLYYAASVKGFRMYGIGNGYRYLSKQLLVDDAVIADRATVKFRWIEQPLDHYDSSENRTWKMRYIENLAFWKHNGPIYLFIGGEGAVNRYFLTRATRVLYNLARDTHGAMFGSEHRYYGQSRPVTDLDADNFRYLSSRQALADIANLLKTIRSSPKFVTSTLSKVIVIGGSYPGNLAVWMRLLYPDIVDVAIASSAPLLAKKDFFEYLEKVADNYEELGTSGCLDKIRVIFQRYERLFATDVGLEQLKSEENICEITDMAIIENKQLFFMDKITEFMVRSQYGNKAHIQKHCKEMLNSSRISSSTVVYNDEPHFWNEEKSCFDYDFYAMLNSMKETEWVLAWVYQTCTEFGHYQSTNSDIHPFGRNIPIEIYYKMCTKLFGPEFDETRIDKSVEETNEFYGGQNLNVTNVIFVNGDMDPWSSLGIIEDLSDTARARVIEKSSHCRELFSDRKNDPRNLEEERAIIMGLTKSWIGIRIH